MSEHITIGDVSPRIQYLGDGLQTVFPYPFPIFEEGDLKVFLDGALQASGYSLDGAGESAGGSVTFEEAPAAGAIVTLLREIVIERTGDFQQAGELRAKVLNDELDRLTVAAQQVAETAGRAVKRAASSPSGADLTLPEPVAGKALKWNAAADGLENSDSDLDAVAAQAAASASAAASSVANAAGSASAAASSAAAADNSESGAATAEANAEAAEAGAEAAAGAAAASAAAAQVAKIEWRGDWSAGGYQANDAVHHQGSAWIATAATSEEPGPAASDWDALALKGLDGLGAGDLIAANNLADVASAATAFANIKQPASESASGVSERASAAEAAAMADDQRHMTPLKTRTAIEAGGHSFAAGNDYQDNGLIRPLIQDYALARTTDASFAGSETLDYASGNVKELTLTGNVTALAIDNWPASGREGRLALYIHQDSTPRSIAWPAAVIWSDGEAPDLSTPDATTLVVLTTLDGGATLYGHRAGGNYA